MLALGALMFLIMGALFFVSPETMGAKVHLDGADPTARIELRAMYGGLELGIGLFLIGCLLRNQVRVGLTACALGYGGLGLGRLLGILMENGAASASIHWLLVAAEMLALVLAVASLRLLPRADS